MGKAEMVTVRTDVLSALITDNNMTKRAFCEQFGYGESWVGGVLKDGRMKPQTAKMIARKYGISYESLVIVPDMPNVRGAGLTNLEAAQMAQTIDTAVALLNTVKESLNDAR